MISETKTAPLIDFLNNFVRLRNVVVEVAVVFAYVADGCVGVKLKTLSYKTLSVTTK